MSEKVQEPLLSKDPVKSSAAPQPQISIFKGHIILNPTITKLNFAAFFLFSLYVTTILMPVYLLQSPLLTNVYHFTLAQQSTLNTIISSIQIALHIFVAPIIGIMSDRYGRKPFILLGIGLTATGTVLLPRLPEVYPYFVIVSMMKSIGFIFIHSAPLLADYIDFETKGRMAGITSVISYAGAAFTTFLNEKTDFKKDVVNRYYQFGIAGLVIGVFLTFGLKGGAYHKKLFRDRKLEQANKQAGLENAEPNSPETIAIENQNANSCEKDNAPLICKENEDPEIEEDNLYAAATIPTGEPICFESHQLSLNDSVAESQAVQEDREAQAAPRVSMAGERRNKASFKAGLKEIRNPWIFTGIVCGFLAAAKIGLGGLNLITLVISFTGDSDNINQAYALMNRQMIAALCSAFFFGFIADKFNKFKVVVVILYLSVIGDLLIIFMPAPDHPMAYIGMAFFGISSAGFMTSVSQLISKYATPHLRASVFAVQGMFGTLGTILTSIIGLYLNRYEPRIPFYMFLVAAFVGFIMLIGLYIKKKNILNSTY